MRIPYESKNTVIVKTPPTTVKPVTSRVVEVLRDGREIEVINGKEVEVIAVEAVEVPVAPCGPRGPRAPPLPERFHADHPIISLAVLLLLLVM